MQNIILIMIFALLLTGAFLFTGINPFRRKSYISLSKQVQEEKFRNVDERFSRLTLKDQIITTVQNTVAMGGSNMKIFAAMLAVFCAAGIGMVKMLFTDTGLALVTGLALIPVPYIFRKVFVVELQFQTTQAAPDITVYKRYVRYKFSKRSLNIKL